jgi:hypothetical protein
MRFLLFLAMLHPGGWTLEKIVTCSGSDPITKDFVYGNMPWHECKQTWELVRVRKAKPCVDSHHHHCKRSGER